MQLFELPQIEGILRATQFVHPAHFSSSVSSPSVRRILIVTAQFERLHPAGRTLTNLLLELGVLGLLALTLAIAPALVRRYRSKDV